MRISDWSSDVCSSDLKWRFPSWRREDRRSSMSKACYAVALGSNRSHHLHGPPRRVLEAAFSELNKGGLHLCARSKIIASPPLGPSRRTFANAAAPDRKSTRLTPSH